MEEVELNRRAHILKATFLPVPFRVPSRAEQESRVSWAAAGKTYSVCIPRVSNQFGGFQSVSGLSRALVFLSKLLGYSNVSFEVDSFVLGAFSVLNFNFQTWP